MNQETAPRAHVDASPRRVGGLTTGLLALAAGLAAFLLVGVAVTELASRWIEFSLLLGLPAGLIAGVVATVLVGGGLARSEGRRYDAALAGGFAGAAFLVVSVAVAVLTTNTYGIIAGALGGVVVAIAVALRTRD